MGMESILFGRDLIAKHVFWRVGNGTSINLLYDRWIPKLDKPLNHFIPFSGLDDLKVSLLLDEGNGGIQCNIDKVQEIIPSVLVPKVLAIPFPNHSCSDQLIWPFTNPGSYSSKSGYRSLYDMHRLSDPFSIEFEWTHNGQKVLSLLWHLDIPEQIKIFLWKCLKGILPVRENVALRLHYISPIYPLCEEGNESIGHLFYRCPRTISVWEGTIFHNPDMGASSRSSFNDWLLNMITQLHRDKRNLSLFILIL